MPFFSGTGITTASHPYQLTAIVYHLGPTRLSGHYRAAKLTEGDITWVTDDEETPRQPSHHECQELLNNDEQCIYPVFAATVGPLAILSSMEQQQLFGRSPPGTRTHFSCCSWCESRRAGISQYFLHSSFSILILYPIIVSYFIIMMHVAARS